MNLFENVNRDETCVNDNNVVNKIEIWIENMGKKSCTFISGLNLETNILKEHITTIKKNIGCNGTIKILKTKNIPVIMFQGNQIEYIAKYLISKLNINKSDIIIKGN